MISTFVVIIPRAEAQSSAQEKQQEEMTFSRV